MSFFSNNLVASMKNQPVLNGKETFSSAGRSEGEAKWLATNK